MTTSELAPPGRVGVIGAGAFGRFCLEAYRATSDLKVVAVADPNPDALALVPDRTVRLQTDWQSIVEASDIEIVHLVTPPHLRQPIIQAAVAAGKSVFCEKPPALSLTELDEMLMAARNHNVVFGVDYVMRHLPAFRFLRHLARARLLGAPRTVSFVNFAQNVPAGHWFWDRSQSGGIFVEHGIHFFDAYGQIFGVPLSVSATEGDQRVAATVKYYDGGMGTYVHEFAYPFPIERTQSVLGFETATLTLEGWIPTRLSGSVLSDATAIEAVARGAGVAIEIEDGEACEFAAMFPDRQLQYKRAIAAGMRDVVRGHRNPTYAISPDSGEIRDSLVIALAAQRAADTGEMIALAHTVPNGEDVRAGFRAGLQT